jgi:transcriptional regulator with XRE-family HTH domain
MPDVLEIFADNLRYYRLKADLTQEALADVCGLHRTYIGAVERRERNISLRNVSIIADALHIEPYLLLKERA